MAPLFGSLLALPAHAGEDPPSLEFLEFLGEWESADGEWLDPELFEEILPEEEAATTSSGGDKAKDEESGDD